MECPNGHGMMVHGLQNWVCEHCGYRVAVTPDTTVSESADPNTVTVAAVISSTPYLPYPAALAIERLRTAVTANASAWDRVSWFKDAVEATVKSLCVYGLGAFLVSPARTPARDETLLKLLVRPSTGHWVELLGVL
jgi:hypothetical protein